MSKRKLIVINLLSVPLICFLLMIIIPSMFLFEMFKKDSHWKKQILTGEINLFKEIFYDLMT